MKVDFRQLLATAVKLLLLCLVVGYLLSVIDIDPLGFIRLLSTTLHAAADLVAHAVRWATPYVLLGAIIVVPVFLLRLALKSLKRGSGR